MQQQHQMPPAPPPPGLRPPFPGMPRLVNDFDHVHLNPNAHHFEHNMHQPPAIQVIQPPGYGHMPDPRSFTSNGKPPVGYVGYIFVKQPVEHVGRKETWAIVHKERMPASQADLKNQIEKHRRKGVTGLDQYMHVDMKGFKRKQIDELIRECLAMDGDPRFEYTVASIKRDTKRRQSGPETSTMQVILKRQARNGIDMREPFTSFGNIRLPSSGVVDLSGASGTEEYEKSSQNSSNGHRPGVYPLDRHLSEPWEHVIHPDQRPPPHHTHSHESAHSHDLGNFHAHGHPDPGNQHAHGQEEHFHPNHGHSPSPEQPHNSMHGHEGKAKKHKDREHKPAKIIIIEEHPSHKSQGYHSGSSSSSESDSSSGDTDRTPDTIISSEGSRYHHKDKKYQKKKHHRKSSSYDHEHEPIKVTYREHRRKEPTRRLPSPPPSRRDRYRDEDVYVEPGFTSHHRPESSYTRERIPFHHRAMSHADERLHDHDMRGIGRRPTVYRRKIASTVHPVDLYDERTERRRHEMLDREIREREETARVRERARRERVDLERMYHAPARPRMDRMHGYHDDHLHGYHDDHLHGYHDDHY